MRISDEEQRDTDFDWFCLDGDGNVGHFASAGFKAIPPSVAKSAEDLSFLESYFNGISAISGSHTLDEHLEDGRRTERFLRSFVAMADRGLFSFDIESYLKPDAYYYRVALPMRPIRFEDLPENVRILLGRTSLKNRSFEHCFTITYAETLQI